MDSRLAALRRLIEGLAPQLELDLAIRLWDGETIPLGSRWSGDLALAIHDPSAITRLLRRPRLPTLIDLWRRASSISRAGRCSTSRPGGGSAAPRGWRRSSTSWPRCALAFERGSVKIFQTVTTRSARGASGLPPTRADLYG